MGEGLDFLPIVAGSLKGVKLGKEMRPICILKREVKSECHMENMLEPGGDLGDNSISPLVTMYFI